MLPEDHCICCTAILSVGEETCKYPALLAEPHRQVLPVQIVIEDMVLHLQSQYLSAEGVRHAAGKQHANDICRCKAAQ